jgi:acylphosphatase
MILATLGFGTFAGSATSQQKQAISATVTGNDQKVGFRAMVMKQAIEDRIDAALAAIREGTKKSSNIGVSTVAAAVNPNLSTFTVVDWTSTSRNITTPYNLVFKLRADDSVITKKDAKDAWHDILKTTLKGEDLKKLGDDD